jgi:hypothetical protein
MQLSLAYGCRWFSLAKIKNIGAFQDSGLHFNNPVNLLLWESQHIWSELQRPDLVLSIGTGTEIPCGPPKASHFRHIFRDGFIPRLYRCFLSSIDGEIAWRELINRLSEEDGRDYVRLNVSLASPAPALDDISKMKCLRESVHLQFGKSSSHLDVAYMLLMARFYFSLEEIPQRQPTGLYHCFGVIRCRLPGETALQCLKLLRCTDMSLELNQRFLTAMNWTENICRLCHRFSQRVDFLVRDLGDCVNLTWDSEMGQRRVSAFPQCMNWFVRQQGLDMIFGSADHGLPGSLECHVCRVKKKAEAMKRKAIPYTLHPTKRIRQNNVKR